MCENNVFLDGLFDQSPDLHICNQMARCEKVVLTSAVIHIDISV